MQKPWKQKHGDRVDQWCHCVQRRYTDWRPNLLHGVSTAVFVGSRTVDSLLPPAKRWRNIKLLDTEGDKHTHTHCRFAARNLTSHLTILRKRKGKNKAEAEEGRRKKVGVRTCRSEARATNCGSKPE